MTQSLPPVLPIAGLGFRQAAPAASLHALVAEAGPLSALATLAAKAPALQPLADRMGLPLIALSPDDVAGIATPTQSPRMIARFGTGSLAEALALAAAGPGARLIGPRQVSRDGTATIALAQRPSA